MTRRGLLAPAVAAFAAACSPLGALNALGPRDPGVRRVARDLRYGDDPRQRMDILAPTPATGGPWPVLVFFYGGGWDSGARSQYGWAAHALAARGFTVVMPDYRVVPQVHFPAFIEDAAAATALAGAVAAQVGLGGILGALVNPFAALAAFVDPGLAEDANCGALISSAR